MQLHPVNCWPFRTRMRGDCQGKRQESSGFDQAGGPRRGKNPFVRAARVENPVYDKVTRRLSAIVSVALFAPVLIGIWTLRSVDQRVEDELLIVAIFLVVVFASLFLLMHLTTNVWIRIDPMQRKVFHIYKLFGYPVYRKAHDLSRFDRISLHRAFRGGYRATLVGREQEVVVSASWKLGWVRPAAEQAATSSGLKMSDQL